MITNIPVDSQRFLSFIKTQNGQIEPFLHQSVHHKTLGIGVLEKIEGDSDPIFWISFDWASNKPKNIRRFDQSAFTNGFIDIIWLPEDLNKLVLSALTTKSSNDITRPVVRIGVTSTGAKFDNNISDERLIVFNKEKSTDKIKKIFFICPYCKNKLKKKNITPHIRSQHPNSPMPTSFETTECVFKSKKKKVKIKKIVSSKYIGHWRKISGGPILQTSIKTLNIRRGHRAVINRKSY